jgi:sulfite exporter TauE/SafE
MTALIAAVFIASLLGSMHCAGMCGAFLAFAVGGESRAALHAAYNGGRLITYTLLGAIAGALGAAVDLGGSAAGIQRAAAILAGALMVGFGLIAILRIAGARIPRLPLPAFLRTAVTHGHRRAMNWSPLARAWAIGLLTTLLPCGWLYAFAITAAGTAHPIKGAITMAAFWAGTLPVMVSLGVGVQALTGPLRRRLPLITSLLLVAVGLSTVFGRLTLPAMAAQPAAPSSIDQLTDHVQSLDSTEMPCCKDGR